MLLKVDSGMINGRNVARRLRGGGGGIPWMAILNPDGEIVVTSDGPEGNIGFPMSPEATKYFLEMLRVARPQMSADHATGIREALSRY